MSKDHKEMKETVSKELDMTPVVDEIDYDLIETGPLYIDPRHKKEGYVYNFISDEPGEIEKRQRRGFHIVQDEMNVGTNKASTTSRFGSAVTVQSKCGRLLVLMAVSEENHAKFMEFQEKRNRQRTSAMGKIEGVPDHLQQFNGQNLGEYKITKR
jgi:hypothetical protein